MTRSFKYLDLFLNEHFLLSNLYFWFDIILMNIFDLFSHMGTEKCDWRTQCGTRTDKQNLQYGNHWVQWASCCKCESPIPSLQFRYVPLYYVQVSRRMFMFLFFIGSWSWKILWQTWEIIIVFTFMIEEVEFSTTFVLNLMSMINIYSHHCLR